jgi:signal transduction histidine kinase/DNA-binding NarL/FixJ family response regulator
MMMPIVVTGSRRDTRRLVELLLVDGDHHRGIQIRKALASAEIVEGARERYHVTQVATLGEALECLGRRRYNAVLLNLFLPDSLGLGTLHQVRRRAPDTPVIALAGRETEQAAALALEAGARGYLLDNEAFDSAAVAWAVRGAIGENSRVEADNFFRQVSDALSEARDLDEVVELTCGLAISRLARGCLLDVRSSSGLVQRMRIAHTEPEWNERLAALAGSYPLKADLAHPVLRVLFSGREELVESAPEGWARRLAYREEDVALLGGLEVRSAMLLPLKARGRAAGVLALLDPHTGTYAEPDFDMASRLALLAGYAIDNALLMKLAEEAVIERRDILATTSHDLRTPLTAVRAGLGLLGMRVEDKLTAEERDLLSNVHRNVVRLAQMLDQLLTQNQLELGPVTLEVEPVNLAEVARQAAEAIRLSILEKGQKLRVNLPGVISYQGDGARLESALLALLDNAHRHTPAGTTITMSGRVSSTGIVIAVHDTGPGIPTEAHEAIFRRFYRHSSRVKGTGMGLGLPMARSVIEAHGGHLSVDSAPGEGAAFYVTLPARVLPDQG